MIGEIFRRAADHGVSETIVDPPVKNEFLFRAIDRGDVVVITYNKSPGYETMVFSPEQRTLEIIKTDKTKEG